VTAVDDGEAGNGERASRSRWALSLRARMTTRATVREKAKAGALRGGMVVVKVQRQGRRGWGRQERRKIPGL